MKSTAKKYKIAFHANGATAGGLAAFIRHLASEFAKRGHSVQLLCDSPGPFEQEMSHHFETFVFQTRNVVLPGMNLGPLRFPNPIAAIKVLVETRRNRLLIEKVLLEAAPDIVLGNGLGSAASFGKVCN